MIIEAVIDPNTVAVEKEGRCLYYKPPLSVIDYRTPDHVAEKWVELICVSAAPSQDHALPDTFPLKPLLRSLCDAPTEALIRLKMQGFVSTSQIYGYLVENHSNTVREGSGGEYGLDEYPWGNAAKERYRIVRVDTENEELPPTFGAIWEYRRVKPGLLKRAAMALGIGVEIQPHEKVMGPLWCLGDAGALQGGEVIPLSAFSEMEEVPEPLQVCPWPHE